MKRLLPLLLLWFVACGSEGESSNGESPSLQSKGGGAGKGGENGSGGSSAGAAGAPGAAGFPQTGGAGGNPSAGGAGQGGTEAGGAAQAGSGGEAGGEAGLSGSSGQSGEGGSTGGEGGNPPGGEGGGGGDPAAGSGAGGQPEGGSPGSGGAGAPAGPATLFVLNNNIENLRTTKDDCPGDWKDLTSYVQLQPEPPDLFLVQQLSGQAQLDTLIAEMNKATGQSYGGLIAEANPTPFNAPCIGKEQQTNAILYRQGKLALDGPAFIWQPFRKTTGACVESTASRTRAIMQRFKDAATGKRVTAASIHWATAEEPGTEDPACALANAKDVDARLRQPGYEADLYVFGGDTNEEDLLSPQASSGFRPWHAALNGDAGGALGYRDAVFSQCAGQKSCLLDNWTLDGTKDRRIDFIFARLPSGLPSMSATHTITFNEAGQADVQLTGTDSDYPYSDHRAIRARIDY